VYHIYGEHEGKRDGGKKGRERKRERLRQMEAVRNVSIVKERTEIDQRLAIPWQNLLNRSAVSPVNRTSVEPLFL
jgi:hypothetical protein